MLGLSLNEVSSSKGFRSQVSSIGYILHDERYKNALKNFRTKNLKKHWRPFYMFSKAGAPTPIVFMAKVLRSIILRAN